MNPLHRLIAYARPYRGRFVAALAAMLVYAAASAGVIALIEPIFDEVLPAREKLAFWAWLVIDGKESAVTFWSLPYALRDERCLSRVRRRLWIPIHIHK